MQLTSVDAPLRGSDGEFYQSLEHRLLNQPMKLPSAVVQYLLNRQAAGFYNSDQEMAEFLVQFDGKYVESE